VRRTGKYLSLHRLTQEAFFCSLNLEEVQKAFESVAKLLNFSFPKSINARPLVDQWPACKVMISHAIALATVFAKAAARKAKLRLGSCPELQELMKNCVW
jgi:hypothetical protein